MRQWLKDKKERFNNFFNARTADGEERIEIVAGIVVIVLFSLVLLLLFRSFDIGQKQKIAKLQTQYSWEICTPAVQDSSGQYHTLIKQVGDDGRVIIRKANFSPIDLRQGIVNVQFSKGSDKIAMESTKYRLVWQAPKPQIKTLAKTKPKPVPWQTIIPVDQKRASRLSYKHRRPK